MHIFIIAITILINHVSHQLHTQPVHQLPEYMNSLIERQTKLKADLNEIKKESQMLRYKLSLKTGRDPNDQVRLMQETLAEERDILGRIQSYLGLPFNISACHCLNMSEKDKNQAYKLLQTIETKLFEVRQKANKFEECSEMKELKSQLNREDTFVRSIRDILQSDCCRKPPQNKPQKPTGLVNIAKSYFVTNLESVAWIYGNTTEKQMKLTVFALASRHNLTKCKKESPVAITNKICGTCPSDLPLWNVGLGKCDKCPDGTIYNATTHVCGKAEREVIQVVEPIVVSNKTQRKLKKQSHYNTNPIAINYIGKFPVANPQHPNCSTHRPFATGDECVACQLPKIFDFNTESCENCPNSFHFDLNLRICHEKQSGLVSDLYRFRNWITERPHVSVYNQLAANLTQKNHTKCPNNKPYFDDITCVQCSLPRVFDIDHNLCLLPPKGMTFNQNMHKLVKEDDLAFNIAPDAPNLIVPKAELAPKAKNSHCPHDAPYYDGSVCVNCQQPFPLFNVETLKCQRCSKNHIYNPAARLCQQNHTEYYTDTAAKNLLTPNNRSLQQYVNKIEHWKNTNPFPTKQCPEDRPYKGRNGCIACEGQLMLFNLETQKCSRCQEGQIYSAESRKCIKKIYYSNLAGNNILEGRNSKISDYYRNIDKMSQNSQLKFTKCPLEKPFVIKGACSNCPANNPLFSLQREQCTTCQNDDYDEKSRQCLHRPRITSPSAPRLFFQGGSLKDYKQQYSNKMRLNNELRPCPEKTPYFDGKKCISCRDDSMIFDMIEKRCINCPRETVYDSQISSCVSQNSLKATLERALINSV